MKILKIELQNINSLKSDFPIVIDFENDQFKDVGLFAITGSTGAGKTTILDAITIALYHNVPRFSGSKATLLDVVSHSAKEAFCRVTFENENVIYEAFWGIRLASATGKILANPQEEVSLKNLREGTILASQKRAVLAEVIKVTQLDYDQFLRSVMLAQGEFASFLSAKGPEKGKLLEQITGEQIYKKIGQGILERKSIEDNKLKEFQSKINSDDVLTDERKIELTQKDKELDVQISASETEIATVEVIVNWYLKSKELTVQSEKLEQESKEIEEDIEKHKTEFELLDLNQKAEPFTELIQNFNRNEKTTVEKTNQLKELEEQLVLLKPKVEALTELARNQSTELENAEITFSDWLPKFDLITQLDSQLKNEADNQLKSKEKLASINQQIISLQEQKLKLSEGLEETEEKIKKGEVFITDNQFLNDVALEISNWTTGLTTLKGHKETLNEYASFVTQKNRELVKSSTELIENKEVLDKNSGEITAIEKEIIVVNEQLSKHNLSDLLAEEKKLSLAESNWKQFKTFSEETTKNSTELAKKALEKDAFISELELLNKQRESLLSQIETQEKAVVDAEKILDLEKSISNYEADRHNLIKGQPCGLCGSKEHPYTENLKSIGVSESELELQNRKESLKTLNNSKSELEIKKAQLTISIENLTQKINTITEELKAINSKASYLEMDCKLSDLTTIDSRLNLAAEQLKALAEKIIVAQQLQSKKDELSSNFTIQKQDAELLKTKDATLIEKVKNAKSEIETKEKSIADLTSLCAELEQDLQSKLSKYNYTLPSVTNTNIFIETIQAAIEKFNKAEKKLDALKAGVLIINKDISNNEKELDTSLKNKVDFTKNISDSEIKFAQLKTERTAILPLEITVESKRNSLQLVKNQLAQKVDLSKKELQTLLDNQREKEAVKVENNKEQLALKSELIGLQKALESQLKDSDFELKQDIENALLNKEDKLKFTQNKESLKEKQLRLQTLKETSIKAIEALNNSKNFDKTEEACKAALEEIRIKKDEFLTEKGKINEAFRKDQEIRDRNQEVYKRIEAQQIICAVWKDLFKIIGNSKDAFNVYVQRLTLKHLLDLANVHLYNLNRRYSLKMEGDYKPGEELNFNLIDHYQTDQARLVDTSSGGEKFIISLALALGLSDLASKNVKIDSLFIDEGFGTLDKNTLETVISTLETLQSQGKMIGIISHVENLKERIPTQIQITKKNNGVSTLAIL